MQKIELLYQNHINKVIFDYYLTCCEQLNNVNFASSTFDKEANELNQIYILIKNNEIFLFTSFGLKDENFLNNEEEKEENKNFNFNSLLDIWVKLKDVKIYSDKNINEKLFKFNIKKFYSTLSFTSNYQDRNTISLFIDNNNLNYKVSNTIIVTLANSLSKDNKIYDKILNSFNNYRNCNINSFVMSVNNVDKNSFLLPYFNHKDCLNFCVASRNNISYLHSFKGNNYIINTLTENNKLYYQSMIKLRKDKFNCFNIEENVVEVTPGLWQILTILQNNKQWKTFNIYTTCAVLTYKIKDKETQIYHMFNNKAKYLNQTLQLNLNNYKLVGKVKSSEIFLLNKLFPNPKNSYFDFSLQQFLGCNYIFKDEKDKEEYKAIDLEIKIDNDIPLIISLAELKHYIGGDLSQKDFLLYFYTDGINIMIERWNKKETDMEVQVIFNHQVSKQVLGL